MSIVDQIREQMTRADGIRGEDMAPLAAVFADEVSRVNQRLTGCSLLLRKGLRSEAIQQANMRPNLLEWAARLDFPELSEWLEILQFYELELPKPLNLSAVQHLQEAMVEEQPLASLLRQHRRLAIARAPLSWRLKVLRSIAEKDSMNPVWLEDIEAWEKIRLAEIPRELEAARSASNFNACRYLNEELSQSHWLIAPPDPLVASARELVESMEYEGQCNELREIGKNLYDAFSAQDETVGRQHRANWRALCELMKRPPPKEISELVEPALLWLEEIDAREDEKQAHLRLVGELKELLNLPASILEIERAHQLATSGGFELDPIIERRVNSVLSELHLASKRRAHLRIAAVVAASVSLLTWFSVRQWRSMRAAELQNSMASIKQMLVEDRIEEAKKFLDQLNNSKPHLIQTVEIQSLSSEVDGRLTGERQRQEEFISLLEALESVEPLEIDLGLVQKAESLARTEPEKSRVFSVRRKKQNADSKLEADHLATVRKETERISGKLDELESSSPESINPDLINRLIDELSELKRSYPRAGSVGRDIVDNVQRRASSLVRSVREMVAAERKKSEALKRLSEARTIPRFQHALEYYIASVDDPVSKREFSEALDGRQRWQVIDQWNSVVDAAKKFTEGPQPASAEQLSRLLSDFESKASFDLVSATCSEGKAALAAIAQRPLALKSLLDNLRRTPLSSLNTLEVIEQQADAAKRYFAYARSVDRDPVYTRPATRTSIDIVSEMNGAVRKISVRPPIKIIKQPKQFLDSIIANLSVRTDAIIADWDREMLRLISRVFEEQELDKAAQEEIIAMFLEASFAGSPYLEERLKPVLIMLRERRSSSPWVIPVEPSYKIDDELLGQMRAAFSSAFRGLSDIDLSIKQLAAASLEMVGFLHRDSQGQIVPKVSLNQNHNGHLITVVADPNDTNLTSIVPLARVQVGVISMLTSADLASNANPLFFLPQASVPESDRDL